MTTTALHLGDIFILAQVYSIKYVMAVAADHNMSF